MIANLLARARGALQFLTVGVWDVRLEELPPAKAWAFWGARIANLAARGFIDDQCMLRASALTFYFLLSIVPVLAMTFGIVKGFNYQETLKERILAALPRATVAPADGAEPGAGGNVYEMITRQFFDSADKMLQQTSGGVIAGIGFLILLWSVFRVLSNIEGTFNVIWSVRRGRDWKRKFTDYTAIIVIGPFLILVAGSLTAFVTREVESAKETLTVLRALDPVMLFGLKAARYIFLWALFSIIYIIIPHTKVSFRSAAFAGVIAGTAYQWLQSGYFQLQFGVSKQNVIYGSFMALPLFLAWVQISWLIVLFGAELCFAHQNAGGYEYEPEREAPSIAQRRRLAVQAAQLCVRRFEAAEPPPDAAQISRSLGIPIRLTHEILHDLVAAGALSETARGESEPVGYLPAMGAERMTLHRVVELYESQGAAGGASGASSPETAPVDAALRAFSAAIEKCPANVPLKDL